MRVWMIVAAIVWSLGAMVASFNVPLLLQKADRIDCPDVAKHAAGHFHCERRGGILTSEVMLFNALVPSIHNELQIRPTDLHPWEQIEGVFYGDGMTVLEAVAMGGQKSLAHSYNAGSNYSSKTQYRISMRLPKGHPGVSLKQMHPAGRFVLGDIRRVPQDSGPFEVKISPDYRVGSLWFVGFILLTGVALIVALVRGPQTVARYGLAFGMSFWMAVFLFGTPFYSNLGAIDSGDDTSIASWAIAIGENLSPDLKDFPKDSGAKDNNLHSWGAGLMLSPLLVAFRVIAPDYVGWRGPSFTILSFTSIMLSFSAVFIYFLAFRWVMPARIAFIAALFTLLATSLLKWTFIRNIFTHSSEAFLLAIGTYCCMARYWLRRNNVTYFVGILLAMVLMIQVRKENLMLVAIPCYFEWYCGLRYVRNSLALLGSVVAGYLVIFFTNRYTHAPGFFFLPQTYLFSFGEAPERIGNNLLPVLFSSNGGIFAWWNLPSWLAGIYVVMQGRTRWKVFVPFFAVFGATVLMCVLHQYPFGYEWQNRFTLKLVPMIFLAAGLLVAGLEGWKQRICAGLFVCGAAVESFILYPSQAVPDGVPRYFQLFTDDQVLRPLGFIDSWYQFLFLPLIGALGLCALAAAYNFYKFRSEEL